MSNHQDGEDEERFNTDIDNIIHVPSRLVILSYLYVVKNADLIFFKRKTNLSWGNLSTHASKLEEAGYVKITKLFREKKPVTILEITQKGTDAFEKYKRTMQGFLGD